VKIILNVIFALSSGSAFASTTNINCKINYISIDGIGSIHAVQSVELSPFTYKKIPIGNFTLEVGLGGIATISTGEKYPVVSVQIFDNKFEAAQDGEVSVNPNYPAQASYQADESNESLNVSCTLAR